mgnify:CR=1 FL=1
MESTYFYENFLGKTDPLDYVKDKDKSIKAYMRYMIIRLQRMFKYNNLPDSIPREILEYYLLCNGTCFIAKESSRLVAFTGHCGGELDEYYRPTIYTVANPALKISKNYKIGTDGVLMRNDSMWLGLYPLMSRYASLLAENCMTIRVADIMLRVMALLTAPDDKSKLAAQAYLSKLENGELAAIAENRFLDGIKMQSPPSNNGSYLTQFIELQQYLKGSFYNEIGLNANFNMKREAIGEGESSLNEDSLLPLCEEMLRCRREDLEKVNKLFGTEITVEFDSAWANNIKEIDLRMAQMANEASQLVEESIEEPQTEETPIEEEPQEVDEEPQEVEEESEVNEEEPVEEKGDDEDVAGSSDKDSDTTE